MRGVVTVFEAVLLVAIGVSLLTIAIPFVYSSVINLFEVSEASNVRNQLELCNDKIIDTARTGSTNTCRFSISRGVLTAALDGIHYTLISNGNICDQHDWVNINVDKHVWQKCVVNGTQRTLEYRWAWISSITIEAQTLSGNITNKGVKISDINFLIPTDFTTLTLQAEFEYIPDQTGTIVEISRVSLTETKVILKVELK